MNLRRLQLPLPSGQARAGAWLSSVQRLTVGTVGPLSDHCRDYRTDSRPLNNVFQASKVSKAIATKSAVYAAADALKARGADPTYERIVEALGGGNNATVGPHLESWKLSSQPPAKPVPESVEVRAKLFVEAVWTVAVRDCLADIDHAKQRSDT